MAKEIQLTLNKIALVDDADFEELAKHKWCAKYNQATGGYDAQRWTGALSRGGSGRRVRMHNVIMGARDGYEVDHKNRNSLDNRRENLRWAKKWQNCVNRRERKSQLGLRGVYRNQGAFEASITVDKRRIYLGRHSTLIEAVRVRNEAAKELHGAFAVLNEEVGCV